MNVTRCLESTSVPPSPITTEPLPDGRIQIILADMATLREIVTEPNDEPLYTCFRYRTVLPFRQSLSQSLSQNTDAWLSHMKAEFLSLCAEQAREKRNLLLAQSDQTMLLDRLGLELPEGSTFAAWLSFLRSLAQALTSPWAKYRQALRDLPKHPRFPCLDPSDWPQKPE